MDAAYVARVAVAVLTHPREALERIRQRNELKHFGHDLGVDYRADPGWESELHRQLGSQWPCHVRTAFDDVYNGLRESLTGFPHGHDADPSLARAVWCIACHATPDAVVETGVARGVTSRFILEALDRHDRGHLWSIDLPPLLSGFGGTVGAAVPGELRDRWTYVRGTARRRLPDVLRRAGQIDLFIQDSVGTEPTVLQELDLAWTALRPGGWLVVNAINRGQAFGRFLESRGPGWSVVAPAGEKARLDSPDESVVGQFAVARKL